MASIELTTVVEAPIEDVWDFISHVDRYPDWVEFVDSVTHIEEGPVGEGMSYRVHGGFGPVKTETEWQITVWDRPRWLTHKNGSGVIRPTLAFELVRTDEGTRLHQTVEFTFLPQFPRLGWWLEVVFVRQIVNLLVGQAMKPSLRRTIRNAKRFVESEMETTAE